MKDYVIRHIAGLHYAVRIFLGTSLLWFLLHDRQTLNSLWAIISLIVVIEPQIRPTWMAFRTRLWNTVIGCGIALGCLLLPLPKLWLLTPAIGISALVSTYVNRVQQGWRVAPVTTGLIMSSALAPHAESTVFDLAAHRTLEVFLGSITAVLLSAAMAAIWTPSQAKPPSEGASQ